MVTMEGSQHDLLGPNIFHGSLAVVSLRRQKWTQTHKCFLLCNSGTSAHWSVPSFGRERRRVKVCYEGVSDPLSVYYPSLEFEVSLAQTYSFKALLSLTSASFALTGDHVLTS